MTANGKVLECAPDALIVRGVWLPAIIFKLPEHLIHHHGSNHRPKVVGELERNPVLDAPTTAGRSGSVMACAFRRLRRLTARLIGAKVY